MFRDNGGVGGNAFGSHYKDTVANLINHILLPGMIRGMIRPIIMPDEHLSVLEVHG